MIWSQQKISDWADDTFGPALSNARVAARANEKMAELLASSNDNHQGAGDEIADIVICLSRLATRIGVDIQAMVNLKMEINTGRHWRMTGPYRMKSIGLILKL
jgi:Protein of unknown function (DUF550)